MAAEKKGYTTEKEFEYRFEMCFKQYFKPLCFYAMSFIKDSEASKDIVHDVFLSIWNKRQHIDFSLPIYPYLLSLTHNRSINYLDHLRVKTNHLKQELQDAKIFTEPPTNGHEELIQNIMKRIGDLPERCKEVMYLCFIECKKYKEIAEILDISVNTVKTHLATGLKILREEFPPSLLVILFLRRKF